MITPHKAPHAHESDLLSLEPQVNGEDLSHCRVRCICQPLVDDTMKFFRCCLAASDYLLPASYVFMFFQLVYFKSCNNSILNIESLGIFSLYTDWKKRPKYVKV